MSGKESEHFAERDEINNYAAKSSSPGLDFDIGGATVNFNKQTGLVSNIIFDEEVPDAEKYIKICTDEFKTDFFLYVELYG